MNTQRNAGRSGAASARRCASGAASARRCASGAASARRWKALLVAGALGCSAATGCLPQRLGLLPPPAPPPPAESLVLRGDTLSQEKAPEPGSPEARLAGAHELFRRRDYGKAADLFHSLTDKSKYSEAVVIEATFYEAECLRLQGRYPRAADTYSKLIKLAPSNPYREQACQHLFEIANFWLDDTRASMKEAREVKDGKRWTVTPRWVHFDKSKPLLDEEGRAVEKLELVHYTDIKGDLGVGDKALFLCGSVKIFNEDYTEADHFFSQLYEHYPNSPYAAQAVELGIISKHMSTGGSDYDGRKVAEARTMVHAALHTFPELAKEKGEFLSRQLVGITLQQAEKDFKTGEFYRRTGHPGSAWFYYELVRMRYPNTKYFDLATERMHELRGKAEKQGKVGLPPVGAPSAGAGGLVPGQPLQPLETAPMPRPVESPPEVAPPPRPLPSNLDR